MDLALSSFHAIAKQTIGGLVLISIGGMDENTLKSLKKKYFLAPVMLFIMKHGNYEKMKPKLIKAGMSHIRNESKEEIAYVQDMFETIFKDYKQEKDVLHGISLKIHAGRTLAVVGHSGGGKSTLCQLIPRFYDVEKGSVIVGGKDVREYDLDVLRKEVSVVLQKNVLFSGTILENLRWGDENATDEECIRACKLACADEFIERMPDKYNTYIEQGGSNVSGGQKQRLCIARALLTVDADYRPVLKSNGFLTRDPRMKERKKYGLKAARRAPQFSKR